jgi:YbbR domain-containing protein
VAREEGLATLANPKELKEILERFFAGKAPEHESKPVLNLIRKNFWEKATAILLACALWLAFGYQRESIRRDFVVPVEYRNVGTEWVIEGPKITEAKVMLMGPEQAFRLLDPHTLKISVDLAGIRQGKQKVLMTRDMVRLPSNLSLEGIKPEAIQISSYKLIPMEVPILVRTKGDLPEGLSLRRIEAVPPLVTVLAPLELHKKVTKIFTEPIVLEEVARTTTLEPKVIFPTEVRFVDGEPPSVKVIIEVEAGPKRAPQGNSS